ncbi:Exopolyphosphatase [Tulasnella sp. 403]|nr:Exopolyphosphatase [Tulasnella sp. 403]
MGLFSDFLITTKKQFLADLKSKGIEGWNVVMGNEAGDLDSIASSLAFSYLASNLNKQPTVAIVQTRREDLYLRLENLYAFELASLDPDQQDLLCIDDIPADSPLFTNAKFILVDHNTLVSTWEGKGKVVGIIDHHDDERNHLDAQFREIVTPVGSCTSLVTKHFEAAWNDTVPPEVATLLLSGIYIDTNALKPGDKGVQIDHDSANFLIPRSTFDPSHAQAAAADTPPLGSLDDELSHRKKDVSHLSTRDLLRRDYKQFKAGDLQVGLSSVPYGLDDWVEKDSNLWKGVENFMQERGTAINGVLTTYKSKKGKHHRELLFLINDDTVPKEVEQRLLDGLKASKELELKKKDKIDVPKKLHGKVWDQGNNKANRKVIAPLVMDLIGGNDGTTVADGDDDDDA